MTRSSAIQAIHKWNFPVAAFLGAFFACHTPSFSQGVQQLQVNTADSIAARKVELGIGKSVIIELPRDAKEVFVANPKVANAVVRSTRKVFIIGMADGQTSVFVMDAEGRQIANLDIAIGRDLNILRRTLQTAIPTSQITVVPVGDTIVLTGLVMGAGDAQQAVDIAKGFVGTNDRLQGAVVNSLTIRGRDQVMLKVTVAEVQRSVIKQLGFDMTGSWQVGKFDIAGAFVNPLTVGAQTLAGSTIRGSYGSGFVDLKALERNGVLRTLAEPTLTAISGESAKFTAGGEIPVPSGADCSPGVLGVNNCIITYEYKQIGVALNFTPVVLSEGRISIRVSTDVTDLDTTNSVQFEGTNAPSFKTRKLETVVELPSGGTLASAGLMQTKSRQSINGFPGLMNVPVIGNLFRSRDYIREETELMILVTPYIAQPTSPGQIAKPDDNFADASDPQAILLARFNRLYGGKNNSNSPQPYRGGAGFVID
jgi:pilus assembly protein CpaC